MKREIAVVLVIALGGCVAGQAEPPMAAAPSGLSAPTGRGAPPRLSRQEAECAAAADRVAKNQAGAAALGTALSVAGAFVPFGGFSRGAMIASNAASISGSVIQEQANAQAEATIARHCRG